MLKADLNFPVKWRFLFGQINYGLSEKIEIIKLNKINWQLKLFCIKLFLSICRNGVAFFNWRTTSLAKGTEANWVFNTSSQFFMFFQEKTFLSLNWWVLIKIQVFLFLHFKYKLYKLQLWHNLTDHSLNTEQGNFDLNFSSNKENSSLIHSSFGQRFPCTFLKKLVKLIVFLESGGNGRVEWMIAQLKRKRNFRKYLFDINASFFPIQHFCFWVRW